MVPASTCSSRRSLEVYDSIVGGWLLRLRRPHDDGGRVERSIGEVEVCVVDRSIWWGSGGEDFLQLDYLPSQFPGLLFIVRNIHGLT